MESSEDAAGTGPSLGETAADEVEQTAKAELDDARKRYLRLLADFDNYKKRMQQRKEEAVMAERKRLLTKFIEIYENLTAAAETIDDAGLSLVRQQFHRMLQAEGVEEIEAIGSPFDYACHHAVATECSQEHAEGIVIDEVRKGYRLGDSVLKPAYVVVSQGDTNGKNDRD